MRRTGACLLVGGAVSCPSWAGPCQGVCLLGSCLFRKTLSSLSADGWGCVPTLLVVWPEASQHWSVQAIGWGQVLVGKWWPSRGLTPMSTHQNCLRQCSCPHSEPQPPSASAQDPLILAVKSGPVSYEVTTFSPVSWCARHPVFTLQELSFCFSQSFGIPAVNPH